MASSPHITTVTIKGKVNGLTRNTFVRVTSRHAFDSIAYWEWNRKWKLLLAS
jgi:hypothetical protein